MPPVNSPKHLPPDSGPRLVLYAQTFHDSAANYISLLPLLTNNTGVTHVIIAAIHLNDRPEDITLNDNPPGHEKFNTLWGEVKWLQGSGIKVMGMLGGAAKGSYERLSGDEASFEAYYAPLKAMIEKYALQGLDLDIEEPVSIQTPIRIIRRLRQDFGPDFIISLAPVATALLPDPNIPPHLRPPRPLLASGPIPNALHPTMPHLSGFSYPELETNIIGREISWYNTQFYCGWGDAGNTQWYDAIVAAGWSPERVVLGVVTNPGNGAGHVDIKKLREVTTILRSKYAASGGRGFGGVMGWEYFNAGKHESDKTHTSSFVTSTESPQAGWVGALGAVLRSEEIPKPPSTLSGITADQIRNMLSTPQPLPTPESQWPSEHIENLVALGFSRPEAIAALNATDGNVDMAASFLFEQ